MIRTVSDSLTDKQAMALGCIITVDLLVTSPIPGVMGNVRCHSRAQQTRMNMAERAASAALLGWPVDCVATVHEMHQRLLAVAAGLPGEVA